MARRTPWYSSCQFVVITPTSLGNRGDGQPHAVYQEVYCSRSRKGAAADARKWSAETGKPAYVIPGAGHKSRRNLPGAGHPPTAR